MHLKHIITGCALVASLVLAGCGSSTSSGGSGTSASTSTVNLTVADTPPTGSGILSFQIQITSAVLQPGNVSILPKTKTVDLEQLINDTALLSSTVIDSGTYTSLTMTFANPQISFVNTSTSTITAGGVNCAPGAVCTFTPKLNQESLTISNTVFPITISADSTTGLNLDLSIPDLLQSDLSVTLANGKSVNLSLLPSPASKTGTVAQIDDVLGTIQSISGSTVNIQTEWGDTLVLTEQSSSVYNVAGCTAANATCLAVGQLVTTDLNLLGEGSLGINSISYLAASGTQFVKGLVISVDTSTTPATAQLLIENSLNNTGLSIGTVATVSLPSATAFALGQLSAPTISSASFSSAADLMTGQQLLVSVASNLVTGSSPGWTAGQIYLEPSQLVGKVTAVDSSSDTLTVNGLSNLFTGTRPYIQQMNLQLGTSTSYVGLSSGASSTDVGDYVAVKGLLFNTVGSTGYPTISAIQVRERTEGN